METFDNLDTRMENFKKYLKYSGLEFKMYQYEGVRWCVQNELRGLKRGEGSRGEGSKREEGDFYKGGGFIADEMGLGKTILMIGTFLSHFVPKTLIVVPLVLVDQWYQQIYKTTGYKAIVFHGSSRWTIDLEVELQKKGMLIVITTYDLIIPTFLKKNKNKKLDFERKNNLEKKDLNILHTMVWDRIVFDEGHHLRNKKTLKYMGALSLKCQGARWIVSGTPIQNKKSDFYHLCAIVGFASSFYTNNNNLPLFVQDFILKRTKKQVGINIADMELHTDLVSWKNKQEMLLSQDIHSLLSFSNLKSISNINSFGWNNYGADLNRLVVMMRARQCCILPKLICPIKEFTSSSGLFKEALLSTSKIDSVINKIIERKENGNGKLVFCHYKEEMDEIQRRLIREGIFEESIQLLDGRIRMDKRKEILNSGKYLVLILQIQTGCEGLNLQEHYNEIYFVSPHWNPAVEDQAVARCHRIGQKKQVDVFRFEMEAFSQEEGLEEGKDNSQNNCVSLDSYVTSVQEKKRLQILF
jgi:SNF2 family DNA or RNA helicase